MAENFLSSVYNSLRHSKHAVIILTPATCVNIMRKFIYLFISPSHDFQQSENEWMNERTNGRTDGRASERASDRASERGREGMNEWMSEGGRECLTDFVSVWMNLSADTKLTSASSNDVQLLITVQLFKQTKMVKICFDWNQCKLLHKQSLSLNPTGSQ